MAFRMSEQARTIKIYNLLAGTNLFLFAKQMFWWL